MSHSEKYPISLRRRQSACSRERAKPPSPTRVNALVHAGWIAWEGLDFDRSAAFSREALALSRELGDKAAAATALYHLGMVELYGRMRAEEAWTLFEESLVLRRAVGDEGGSGRGATV